MTENIEKDTLRYYEIMKELFHGKDAAFAKYAKVRHTLYEMNFFRSPKGYTLAEINSAAKAYFANRFLPKGVTIRNATEEQLKKGYRDLEHAVKDGCYGRCLRLVNEMNEILEREHFECIDDPESFLDAFSFYYKQRKDEFGNPAFEPGRGDPILDFYDDLNRKDYYDFVQFFEKRKKMISPITIRDIVRKYRKGLRGD